jgi:hypothetical protein
MAETNQQAATIHHIHSASGENNDCGAAPVALFAQSHATNKQAIVPVNFIGHLFLGLSSDQKIAENEYPLRSASLQTLKR